MNIRALIESDIDKLRLIHEKYYAHEFNFPSFTDKFICGFTVTDDTDNIITAGGIRTIIEMVLITDKDKPVRVRREAVYNALNATKYLADQSGYNQIHIFVQGEDWERHLKKVGFNTCKGSALYLNI